MAIAAVISVISGLPSAGHSANPAAAVTAENPSERDLDMVFPFRIGPVFAGDLGVRILADGEILLPADALFQLASLYLSPAGMNLLSSVPAENGFQSLRRLHEAGVVIVYNAQSLEISLHPSADQAASADLSLGRRSGRMIVPTEAEGVSGFLNLFTSVTADYQGTEPLLDRGAVRTLMDGAAHYRGFTLEGESSLDEAQGFRRLGTRIVHDDIDNLLRFHAGDILTGSTGFQNNEELLGLSVRRSFAELNPGASVRSTGAQSFRLDQPSRVDVFVNGNLRRTLNLQPGNYNLEDLGFTGGGNEVRLVIEDDTGRRSTLDLTVFFDSTLLAPGVTEFGLAGGIRSELRADARSYFENEPVVSGFLRHGLSNALTFGANAQADHLGGLVGGEATFATPVGAFSLEAAYSREWDNGSGYGLNLDYTLSGFRLHDEDDSNRRLAVSIEYQLDELFALGGARSSLSDYRFVASYSQTILDTYRLSFSGSTDIGGDTSNRSDFSTSLSGPFLISGMSFAATLGHTKGYSNFNGIYGLLSLSIDLGPGRRASGSFDSRDTRLQTNYVKSMPDEIGAVDYNVRAITDEGQNTLFGSIHYTGNRVELQADHEVASKAYYSEVQTNRTVVRANTALVFAGSTLTLSRPVREGFAIIEHHPTIADNELVIDPNSDLKRYESDFFGPAVLNDLSAYSHRSISIDVMDLPIGYDLGAAAFDVTPRYKAGYAFTVGSDYSVTLVATMLDKDGKPVPLLSGAAREEGNAARSPVQVFTNREGRLVAQGLRPGRWVIELGEHDKLRYVTDIPQGTEGVIRLATLSPNMDN